MSLLQFGLSGRKFRKTLGQESELGCGCVDAIEWEVFKISQEHEPDDNLA